VRYRWQDVDWVELGCRGWEIDETGAYLEDAEEMNHAHLDRETGHLFLSGFPAFTLCVLLDLRAARVAGYFVGRTSGTAGNSTGVFTITAPTIVEWGFPP